MKLYLQGNDFHFELENISRLFLPQEKIVTQVVETLPGAGADGWRTGVLLHGGRCPGGAPLLPAGAGRL